VLGALASFTLGICMCTPKLTAVHSLIRSFERLASSIPAFAVTLDKRLSDCGDQFQEEVFFYSCVRRSNLNLAEFDEMHKDSGSEEELTKLLAYLDTNAEELDYEDDQDDVWEYLGVKEEKPMLKPAPAELDVIRDEDLDVEEDYSDDWEVIAASRFPEDVAKPVQVADTMNPDEQDEFFFVLEDDWYQDMPVPDHLMELVTGKPAFDNKDYEELLEEEDDWEPVVTAHGQAEEVAYEVEIQATLECDDDDYLCQSLMRAHRGYQGDEDRMRVLDGEHLTLGGLVQQAVSDAFGSGTYGMARDMQTWVSEAVQQATKMAGLDKLLGYSDAEVSVDINISHEEPDPDAPMEIDVEMDVMLDMEEDDHQSETSGNSNKDTVMSIDVDIEDMTDEEAKKVSRQISKIMEKVDLSGGVVAITNDIVPQIEKEIPKVLDSANREVVWETVVDVGEDADSEDEYLDEEDPDRTVSSDITVSLDEDNNSLLDGKGRMHVHEG